jgi:hypothetical protein
LPDSPWYRSPQVAATSQLKGRPIEQAEQSEKQERLRGG